MGRVVLGQRLTERHNTLFRQKNTERTNGKRPQPDRAPEARLSTLVLSRHLTRAGAESPPNQSKGPMGPQEHRVERRLVAIFAADVAGYSRLMDQDETGTLRALTAHREVMDRLIVEHGGRIANTAGDSILAEFPSAVDAVQCAIQVQDALAPANQDKPEAERLQFRIGVHVGDVMVRGGDLLGDGVNIAARLQSLADPGGVCLSDIAYGYV